MASKKTPAPPGRLAVVVIGDVHVDWLFQSSEPAPSRVPNWRPWAQSSFARLYCVPAGAWLAGHMLYGAITTPPEFERTHTVSVDTTTSNELVDVKLRGEPSLHDEQLTLKVFPNNNYVLRTDDAVLGPLSESLEFKISKSAQSGPVSFEVGLGTTQFRFEGEDTITPGFFEVSQLNRCYRLENVFFSDKTSALTTLLIQKAAIEFTYKGNQCSCRSLAIYPVDSSPDGPTKSGEQIRVDALSALSFKKATLWVNYGNLQAQTITVDRGKLVTIEPKEKAVQLRHLAGKAIDFLIYNYPDRSLLYPDPECMQLTLSELDRFDRYVGQRSSVQVFRRCKCHGTDGPTTGLPNILTRYQHKHLLNDKDQQDDGVVNLLASAPAKLVFIDDEGLGFCDTPALWNTFADNKGKSSYYVIKVSRRQSYRTEDSALRFLLETKNEMRSIMVVSADSIRDGLYAFGGDSGSKLSMTLSWEQTVDDLIGIVTSALNMLSPMLLIVRFGMEGVMAVHYAFDTVGKARVSKIDFCCDPTRVEGEYAPAHKFGSIPGQTTVLACAVAAAVAEELQNNLATKGKADPGSADLSQKVVDAATASIQGGLQAARRYFDMGYGTDHKSIDRFSKLQLPTTQVFRTGRVQSLAHDGIHSFSSTTLDPTQLHGSPPSNDEASGKPTSSDWSFLDKYLARRLPDSEMKSIQDLIRPYDEKMGAAFVRGVNALDLAREVVRYGFEKTLRRRGYPFPYGKFGEMFAVERREIEAIRSLKNVLAEHVFRTTAEKPISVAVFGPPGSGKSFAVRQVAGMVADDLIREFTFNIAQFTSFQDITKLLLEVRDARLRKKIPLVFFDEFDCAVEEQKLGWLKYFLAPMQDGAFQHGDSILGTGKAIFVFAGGIAPTMQHFKDPDLWEPRGRYKDAKGPDFESRLRGYLNVEGINSGIEAKLGTDAYTESLKAHRFTFILRRAILARYYIERIAKETANDLLDIDGNAEIDTDVINALLFTGKYTHGARSMEAFFDTCHMLGEHAITKTMIASPEILEGHVDSGFFDILYRRLPHRSLIEAIINFRRDTHFPGLPLLTS